MPYKLSPSSLNLYTECPRCFWLDQNKGIKRPSGPFPSLPSGMDGIIKKYFDAFRSKGSIPPEISSLEGVALYSDMDQLKIWRNNFKGIQWTDPKGNLFRGAVDDMLVKDGKLIVLDYKTRGYALKEDTTAHYQNQLDIYNALLRREGHQTHNYAYLLFYMPKKILPDSNVEFTTPLVKMDIDVKNAERLFKDSIRCLEGPEPKAPKDCDWCAWGK